MWTAQQIISRRKERWTQHHNIEQDREYTESVAEYIVGDKGESLRQEIANEPRLLIEMVFVIVDKEMKTIPFFMNDVQWEFSNDLYQAERDHNSGTLLFVKFMILKGRQQGFTAYITAEQLARTIIKRNFSGFTVADKGDNTTTIFEDKAKFPYNHLPEPLKPTEKFNNRKELQFEKLNSKWRVATGSKDMGRSKTINFLHISEAAFLECSISDIQAAIGDALTKDAIQIYESTGNGYNEFKDVWDSGEYICKFYEWWKTSEYRLNFESPEKESWFKETVNAATKESEWIFTRCKWLIEKKRLDWQQVYWYFNKWKSYANKEKVKQEYPCTPDEAFLASGNCVFDKEQIIMRKEHLKEIYEKQPPKRGYFIFEWNDPDTQDYIKNVWTEEDEREGKGKAGESAIRFTESAEGHITIYEDVQRGYPYVLGGDTKGEGKDYYAGTVINNTTGNRCAVIHMQATNSKPYTWQMYCLGLRYNVALIGIEMNWNTAPIEELQRLKYPKQYTRRQYDAKTKKTMDKFGWKTDGNTRPLIIDKEIDLIENNIDLFTDITFLDECLTFVYDKDGRPDAESGKHDDVLLSDMIANEIRGQQTREVKIPEPVLTGDAKRIHDHIESLVKKKKKHSRYS